MTKSARNFKTFSQHEFADELQQINWMEILNPNIDTQNMTKVFLDKIEKLLDEMAPIRKLTKRDIGLQQRPWITKGILISMQKRDKLYKDFAKTRDNTTLCTYKRYRNMIITLMRRSKKNHYVVYFAEHQANVKKLGKG